MLRDVIPLIGDLSIDRSYTKVCYSWGGRRLEEMYNRTRNKHKTFFKNWISGGREPLTKK